MRERGRPETTTERRAVGHCSSMLGLVLLAVLVIVGVVGAAGAGVAGAAQPTSTTNRGHPASAALLTRFEQAARAHGVDPDRLLAAPLHLRLPTQGGGTREVTMSVAQALADFGSTDSAEQLPSLPEANAGDVVHAYVGFGTGSQLAYKVTTVPAVPGTPPVIVPPLGPVPPFYDVGGPLVNVVGSGYQQGYHTVGNFGLGSNVDTAPGAPSPFPVWLPVLTGGSIVPDTSIDFTGHAIVTQSQDCVPYFNYCVAVGALIGDGATLFNQSLPVAIP